MAKAPVDIPIQVKGLSDLQKLERRMEALEREVTRLQKKMPQATNQVVKFGRASKGAAGGVGVLNKSLQGVMTTVAPLLTAVAGLTAGFKTLADQDFAEAKVRTLGVDSDELRERLKETSKELKGQASILELTAASYDVASAGFASAAEAQEILKASSLGAVGGFSDINTVANATTSVLNAYGLEAKDAARLVDQFVQTQNDGKIVLDEYARNIGKLAPVAASLGIPLAEVNGAIAAITANGLPAEIAITALRSGISRLAAPSKEATDILAKYGVQIDANTIANEGLEKSLEKLAKVTDKADLQKLIGTDAGQALAPLLNDLGKLNQLILNQADAAGVAQRANDQAANTIQGAWKEVTTAFQNLFSEQSELAASIIPLLQGVADVIEGINSPLGRTALEVAATSAAVLGLVKAVQLLKLGSILQFFSRLIPLLVAGKGKLVAMTFATRGLTAAQLKLNAAMMANPWTLLAAGVVAVGAAAFKATKQINDFNASIAEPADTLSGVSQQINIVNGKIAELEEKAKGGGNAARGYARQIAVLRQKLLELKGQYDVLVNVRINYEKFGVEETAGFYGPAFANSKPKKPKIDLPPVDFGGGSSGGGGGAAPRESQLPGLREETKLKERLLELNRQQLQAQLEGDAAQVRSLEGLKAEAEFEKQIADIQREKIPELEKEEKKAQALLDFDQRLLELRYEGLELDKQRKETLEGILLPIQDEIALLQGRINGNEEEIRQNQEILALKKQILAVDPNADTSGVAAMVQQRDQLREQAEAADALKQQYESLANSIAGNLTGAFKDIITGAKSAEEALADAFAGIADAFLDMAMKMIQQWLVMKAMGILFGGGGGASPIPTTGPKGDFSFLNSFAGGGYTGDGPRSGGVDGQGGFPAILHSNETVIDHTSAMSRYSPGNAGGSAVAAAAMEGEGGGGAGADAPMSINISGGVTQIGNDEFIRKDQLPAIIAQSSKAGEQRTLRKLQMSSASRRKLGM